MLTPKQFKQQVQRAFANNWSIVIGYGIVAATIKTLGNEAERKLMARAIADEIESREWAFESETITEHIEDDDEGSILLDGLTGFIATNGDRWGKDVSGKWVNLDD